MASTSHSGPNPFPLHYTYDDVLLRPGLSEVLPTQVTVKGQFSRRITLNIPIISAAMDTVTDARTAIVMAKKADSV